MIKINEIHILNKENKQTIFKIKRTKKYKSINGLEKYRKALTQNYPDCYV